MKTYLIAISLFGIAIITTAIEPSITYGLQKFNHSYKYSIKKWINQNQTIGKMPRELMEEWQ